jgi:hypothetical protein
MKAFSYTHNLKTSHAEVTRDPFNMILYGRLKYGEQLRKIKTLNNLIKYFEDLRTQQML